MHGMANPREMSAEEIFQEVAALPARGYVRLKKRTPHLADALAGAEGAHERPSKEPAEVCRKYGISSTYTYKLKDRARSRPSGPRFRRPISLSCPQAQAREGGQDAAIPEGLGGCLPGAGSRGAD